MAGIMSIRKSMPFLWVRRETQTMFIVLRGKRMLGFGANLMVSTAFGIVKQILGSIFDLKVKFSLHELLTVIAASISFKYHLLILFILINPTS